MQTLSDIFASALAEDMCGNDGQYSAIVVKNIRFEPVETDCERFSRSFPGMTMTMALTKAGSDHAEEFPLSFALSPEMSYCDEINSEQWTNPASTLLEHHISDVDYILDYYGLNRRNIVEHQGFIDPIEMPPFIRDAFVSMAADGNYPYFENEEDRKLFADFEARIEAADCYDDILFETQGGYSHYYGDLVSVVFAPWDLNRETPAIEQELSFEQREVLDAFMKEAETLGASPSAKELVDAFGKTAFVPQTLLDAAEERMAHKFGISVEALSKAVEETQRSRSCVFGKGSRR